VEPGPHEDANVVATIRLIEALKNNKNLKKLVYSSSSSCYGNPVEIPTSEQESIKPLSPYALQKYTAEQYCLLLGERFDIPVISLRYFNAYGPRSYNPLNKYNAYTSVIGIFHHQKINGQNLTITGDGSQRRDFVHVKDIARANYYAAKSPVSFEFFNVGCGICYSILEIAKYFSHPYVFVPKRAGEAEITLANIDKIKKVLQWKPEIDIIEGIQSYSER
jgi:UDP-glucose 4-epimerase